MSFVATNAGRTKVGHRATLRNFQAATVVVAAFLLWPGNSFAQEQFPTVYAPDTLKVSDYVSDTYVPYIRGAGKNDALITAEFEIQFTGPWPTAARQAFQRAADIWGSHLESSVPIVVEAEWAALDEGVLGSAGPFLLANFGAGLNNTWYPAALANALVEEDLQPAAADIGATFNSNFDNWYFGLDGQPGFREYDFLTVVLHELGHGLGFTGSFDVEDGDPEFDECPNAPIGFGCWGIPTGGGQRFPIIFDRSTEDVNEVSLLTYPSPSQQLGDILQSDQVFFDSEFSRPINDDVPISLYAPANFEAGSSFSHLDETVFASGTINSLMTPSLGFEEVVHSPGPLVCAMFQDIGWPLGEDCIALFSLDGVLSFNVTVDGAVLFFDWQLASLVGLERVELQRSFFGEDFVTITVVEGDEINLTESDFQLDDVEPGAYTFRLRLVYENGDVAFSPARIIEVPFEGEYSLTEFFPNPVQNQSHAYLQVDRQQQVYAEVYDASGRRREILLNQNANPNQQVRIELNPDSWTPGVYFILVVGETFKASRSVVYVR